MGSTRHMRRWCGAWFVVTLAAATGVSGCGAGFIPARFSTSESLYNASRRELDRKKYDNAQAGFEKLTNDLSTRDPLLPLSYYWLAVTHERRGEFLLAAQSYTRVTETFPDDSLVPWAMLHTARAYQRLWRKPMLDGEQGQRAKASYEALVATFPGSQQSLEAAKRLKDLDEWFATKDFEAGMHYFRRKAFDSAILYFNDVIRQHPEASRTREAWLRLHASYKAIRYTEDATETCTRMRQLYPDDREVRLACGEAPVASR
jgi:outer membrane assembly lipoprotein YfiO